MVMCEDFRQGGGGLWSIDAEIEEPELEIGAEEEAAAAAWEAGCTQGLY